MAAATGRRPVQHVAAELADLGPRTGHPARPLPHGRGDEFHRGPSPPDPRDAPKGATARDLFVPDLQIDTLKVKSRDFR